MASQLDGVCQESGSVVAFPTQVMVGVAHPPEAARAANAVKTSTAMSTSVSKSLKRFVSTKPDPDVPILRPISRRWSLRELLLKRVVLVCAVIVRCSSPPVAML